MALQTRTEMEVVLLGWSPPREYKAGVTDDGHAFPAGRSMRICVGTADTDFDVCKVDKEVLDQVHATLLPLGRGVMIKLTFTQRYGQNIVLGVEALAAAKNH